MVVWSKEIRVKSYLKSFSHDEILEIKELTSNLGIPCDVLSEEKVYITKSKIDSQYDTLNKLLTFIKVDLIKFHLMWFTNKIVSCNRKKNLFGAKS